MTIYQPKGSMCVACADKNNACSHLDFSKMKIIEQVKVDDDFLKIVRCTDFKRGKND